MTTDELRRRFLEFFREKAHAVIPSASVIPENDPTVLFTTAGMHPLVPYLLGETHPAGRRLANRSSLTCAWTTFLLALVSSWTFEDSFLGEMC